MVPIIVSKNKTLLFFLILSLSFLMTSCVIKNIPNIEDGGLITKRPCGAPCFLGITPGITTKSQTIEILHKRDLYDLCVFDGSTNGAGETIISCNSFNIYYSYVTNTVTVVGFKPSQILSVKQIISVYGYPDAVIVNNLNVSVEGDLKPRILMSLYFDTIRAAINLPVEEVTKYAISTNTQIDRVTYFDQDSYMKSRIFATTWNGFGIYDLTP